MSLNFVTCLIFVKYGHVVTSVVYFLYYVVNIRCVFFCRFCFYFSSHKIFQTPRGEARLSCWHPGPPRRRGRFAEGGLVSASRLPRQHPYGDPTGVRVPSHYGGRSRDPPSSFLPPPPQPWYTRRATNINDNP